MKQRDKLLIAGTFQIVPQFNDKPHRPVWNKIAVILISRITHRQHSFRNAFEFLSQQKVLQKSFFHSVLTGKQMLYPCRKKAVTQPAGTFSRRAIHEYIRSILTKGFYRRIVNRR